MRFIDGQIIFSATDLSDYLLCEHLTQLDLASARGALVPPERVDELAKILSAKGDVHEQAYLQQLRDSLRVVVEVANHPHRPADLMEAERETLAAMRSGADVIYQATFFDGHWAGRADFLVRVERPSQIGSHSYEIVDTKLARHVKAEALVQLCEYSRQLERVQGLAPEYLHLVLGDTSTQTRRVSNYSAYTDRLRLAFEQAVTGQNDTTYPNVVQHCSICRWNGQCGERRRADDHLSLVAGMRRHHARHFISAGITSVAALAETPSSLRVERVNPRMFERLTAQARLQMKGRLSGAVEYEVLEPEPGRGLSLLPLPSAGDIFFDMEGDPVADGGPLEYLFGAVTVDRSEPEFHTFWALHRERERAAFEEFMDFAMDRLKQFPNLHIYHYAAYEKNALRRLASHYATREDEVDVLLRGDRLVDLYAVVRHSIRTSQESLGLKKIERLYMAQREDEIVDAGSSIVEFERWTLTGDQQIIDDIGRYNEQDCISTWLLREWLEQRRAELAVDGKEEIPRPDPADGALTEAQLETSREVRRLFEGLVTGIPFEDVDRNDEQRARWLLAHLLEWHRRDARPEWWAFFERMEMREEDRLADSATLAGLVARGVVNEVGEGNKKWTHYAFDFPIDQEHKIRAGKAAIDANTGRRCGQVVSVDNLVGRLVIARTDRTVVESEPVALMAEQPVAAREQPQSLKRLAEWVIEHGIDAPGPWRAARDLLLRRPPRRDERTPLRNEGEDTLAAARRIALSLNEGCLAIQGPPGSGKTTTAAAMIVDLVRHGRRVGVAATAHKAIANLLAAVVRQAEREGLSLRAIHKAGDDSDLAIAGVTTMHSNAEIDDAIRLGEVDVVAGTSWLFSRGALAGSLDTLFVDEAGQMSLANLISMGEVARNLVLLGDPNQLPQPSQGIHPEGADVSALGHMLAGRTTIPDDLGLFLDTTWRLHPAVGAFISSAFYEGRLESDNSCAAQRVVGEAPWGGTGLRYAPVAHQGNRAESVEEAERVAEIVDDLLGRRWIDCSGRHRDLTLDDILVVAPYNAHVARLQSVLPPGAQVGTVDRFQGQEGVVVIFSMATSSPDDQPRGMDFLYSHHRLNVAISRARAMAVLVCSPSLLDVRCTSEEQMRLANALCRFVETAEAVPPSSSGAYTIGAAAILRE